MLLDHLFLHPVLPLLEETDGLDFRLIYTNQTSISQRLESIAESTNLYPKFYIQYYMTKSGLLSLIYVDFKSRFSGTHDLIGAASLDEYEFIKNAYFEKRAYEINDGNIVDFIGE